MSSNMVEGSMTMASETALCQALVHCPERQPPHSWVQRSPPPNQTALLVQNGFKRARSTRNRVFGTKAGIERVYL